MQIREKLIPDSSFFLCFLDDLEGIMDESERFGFIYLVARKFYVEIPGHVHYEVGFERRNPDFSDYISVVSIDDYVKDATPYEPLRLVIDRGEFEVILLSYVHKTTNGDDFIFILDDDIARKKVQQFLPVLSENLTGTIGFLSHLEQNNYISAEFTSNIFRCIGESKFRISKKILDSAIKNIEGKGK